MQVFCRDLVTGLQYMHSKGVVHRDLNPAQLLFNERGRIMIGDLDNARFMTPPATRG